MAADRPSWWKPGMSAEESAVWEAAQRCADAAPELKPGDDVALRLKTLYSGFPQFLRDHRAQRPDAPAA